MKTRFLPSSLLVLFVATLAFGQQSIVNTKHNLSVSGPGSVRALSEDQVCIFCHTPHGGRDVAPLWNRRDSGAGYIPYDSPTLDARPGQPTGTSKLCLSCHDGTIAMGDLLSESAPISMAGSQTMPPGGGLIGTDLRDDHPISFPYHESLAGGELAPPGSWDQRVKLDAEQMMQCTTCHDPHDNQFGDFLVMSNMQSLLCRQCHTPPFFDQTPHAFSGATWNGGGQDPWPHTDWDDVQSNACMNCHQSHHAGGPVSLMTELREEQVCFNCHNGSVAESNFESLFNKPFRHPVERATGQHEMNENPLQSFDHVECADCHNPHRAREIPSEPPFVQGVLEGVSGLNANGMPVVEANFEYEVCFKCHAEDNSPPLRSIRRQIESYNLVREFNPASPSFHPVEAAGRSMDVPSLISPLSESSLIYCSDCHGNDDPSADIQGTAGPHASNFEFMLKAEYRTDDYTTESPQAYALCYSCHSRESILANESFSGHSLHVVDNQTSCATCHDSHGIDYARGNSMNNAHLINFDVSVVSPSTTTGMIEYQSLGLNTGNCTLNCHGVEHDGEMYP